VVGKFSSRLLDVLEAVQVHVWLPGSFGSFRGSRRGANQEVQGWLVVHLPELEFFGKGFGATCIFIHFRLADQSKAARRHRIVQS